MRRRDREFLYSLGMLMVTIMKGMQDTTLEEIEKTAEQMDKLQTELHKRL